MIIAIDGPAGAGKSTVAKILAQKLKFIYIDTGAMYRAITLKVIETNTDIKDEAGMVQIARNSHIDLLNSKNGSLQVILDARDVTELIRHPRITKLVSDIAKIKEVREEMLKLQRRLGSQNNSVLDGRDIGTVVFPEADKKFYIDAQFDARVKRRYKELIASGQEVTLADIDTDLRNRDYIDSSRKVAPLKKADDAIYIDTTNMSIKEVVKKILNYIAPGANLIGQLP